MAMGEDNKRVVKKAVEEVWDKGNFDAVDTLYSEDFVDHNPGLSGPDREGQKRSAQMLRYAFPDLHTDQADMMVEGDRVLLHYHASGTHQGELFGVKPSGKKVCMGGMSLLRVEDGKIKESWGYFDTMNLLEQIGAVPPFESQGFDAKFPAGAFAGKQEGYASAQERAASHFETTVRAGQTDLYSDMKKHG